MYSLDSCAESHLIPLPSIHSHEGSSFPGLDPPHVMVNLISLVAVYSDDSSMVKGHYGDLFTSTWLTIFGAQSQI